MPSAAAGRTAAAELDRKRKAMGTNWSYTWSLVKMRWKEGKAAASEFCRDMGWGACLGVVGWHGLCGGGSGLGLGSRQ